MNTSTGATIWRAQRFFLSLTPQRTAEALLVRDGRVIAAGTYRGLRQACGRGVGLVDLGDATVTPGLVDSHTHFFFWALGRSLVVDLSDLHSLEAVLKRISTHGPKRKVGDWIVGRGFDKNRWSTEFPTARDLDAVTGETAAIVHSRDGHSAWLNTAALQRIGLSAATPDPAGGRYLRDAHGQLTGIVQETAIDLLPDPLRDLARCSDAAATKAIDQALTAAYQTAWAAGITGVHSMDGGASLTQLLRHRNTGKLGLRIVHAVQLGDLDHAAEVGLRTGLGDDWLRIGAIKIFSDGALGSQTALMFDPYPERDGFCGVPQVAGAELRDAVQRCVARGWTVWIHAIGDRAVSETIDAITAARAPGPLLMPHRIEHAQCVRPRDAKRMAKAGIVASVQPCHILGDIPTADRHWPKARRNAYPFRTLLDAGVLLAAGSDIPIEAIDPRRSLFGAVVRADDAGTPAEGWFPEQRLTTAETLHAFTRGAAASIGLPAPYGTLAVGAPADMTIWEENPLKVAPADLLTTKIHGCAVDGIPHLSDH